MTQSELNSADVGLLEARYGHLALFRDVDMVAVAHLLSSCREIEVPAGETVLEEGTFNDALYVVLDGGVKVCLGAVNATPLMELGIGACVGELSILSRLNVSAFVVASDDARLLVIRDEHLWSLIGGSHEFACNLLKVMSGRIRADNTRLKLSMNAQERYARASRVDALTGLYNRRWLDEVLERQCHRSAADGSALSLLLVDIDHFKRINDTHGHLLGDEALKCVAAVLRRSTRPMDLAARFGGEEFAVLLHGIDLLSAAEIGERVRADIAEASLPGGDAEIALTVSVGVAELGASAEPAPLVAEADRALYRAKRSGRNRVVVAADLPAVGSL